MKHQRPGIEKFHLDGKDPLESKYQLLINGRENIGFNIKKIQRHLSIIHKQLMMYMKI